MKPYYADDLVTIYHGDSREWMPEADLVLTDPPYGIDYDPSDEKFEHKTGLCAVVGDDAPFDPRPLLQFPRLILWGANCYTDRLPASPKWLGWDKATRNALGLRIAEMELAWTNCVRRPQMFRHLWSGGYRASEQGSALHPTQKPVALMTWCLSLVDTVGLVLDPYMGSGPVLAAAKRMGIRSVGIEIEERYCEIAARRCSQEVLGLTA